MHLIKRWSDWLRNWLVNWLIANHEAWIREFLETEGYRCERFGQMLAPYPFWHQKLVLRYLVAGLNIGGGVSDLGLVGKYFGFDKDLERLIRLEWRYAKLGYKPLSIDAFEATAGWGKPLVGLAEKLPEHEGLVLYAQIYKDIFLRFGEAGSVLQQMEATGAETQVGTYQVPSTEAVAEQRDKPSV